MKKVSVIIPMYNSAVFIRQCIQSVTAQTYHNIEIIVIDDGSVDQSREICEELSLKDERIMLFSQSHKGVSSVRNCGLDKATGEYLFFLDSDDAIHPLLIEELVDKMEIYQADLTFCICKRLESLQVNAMLNGDSKECGVQWDVGKKGDSLEWFHSKYYPELTGIGGKLIRKSAMGTLRFDENLCTGEDTVFLYYLSCSYIKMVCYPMEWYYYRMHSESITHRDRNTIFEEHFKIYEIIRDAECKRKSYSYAINWEERFLVKLHAKCLLMQRLGDEDQIRKLKKKMMEETKMLMLLKSQIH